MSSAADRAEDLADALWGVFREEIVSGEPVFFCFSQETLTEALSSHQLGDQSPLEAVCAVARGCFSIYRQEASLRPEALAAGSNGISLAIVLVCQQILAVEEMVREGSRFTENAYFPRLRSFMSSQLPQLSVNPISFSDFESIWRTFAREIRGIEGSTDETITFEFGAYSGVNKARRFPLSQALLSRSDLLELLRRCHSERLRKASARDVWVEIRRERNHLGRRGQRLVNSGFLRERIVEQVQRFARRVSIPTDTVTSVQRPDQVELAFGLDVIDFVREEYRAFLIVKGTSKYIDDDARVTNTLHSLLTERGHLLCVLGDFGDHWICRDSAVAVGAGDSLLVVGTVVGVQCARAFLNELTPAVTLDSARIVPLGTGGTLNVCPVTLPQDLSCVVRIRAGRIVGSESAGPAAINYEWLGGICLDGRARKYLRQALPYGVRFSDTEFRLSELVGVGDIALSWEAFERATRKLEGDAAYDLRFPNGNVAHISVGVLRQTTVERMGFLVDSNGFLSPTLEQTGDADSALIGFAGPRNGLVRAPTTRALANLVGDLASRQGRRLTDAERDDVRCRVDASSAPDNFKRILRELLEREPIVREATLKDLLVYP